MDSFSVIPQEGPPEDGVSFLINGRDLMDLLGEHGSTDGPLTWRDAASSTGQSVFADPTGARSERLMVLVCGCGISACGSTFVTVTRTAETVTWSDFSGYLDQRVYFPLGPFTFESATYDAALAKGRELVEDFRQQNDPSFVP